MDQRSIHFNHGIESSAGAPGRRSSRILIADASASIRYLFSEVLQSAGFSTLEVTSGLDLVETAVCENPALIFLDFDSPQMMGGESMLALKNKEAVRHIPVIAMTFHESTARELSRLEVSGVLLKPTDASRLLAAVSSVLDRG